LSIFTTDKMVAERPQVVQNFLDATVEAWDAARKNPEAACKAHVRANPEVEFDDCLGNLKAVLTYVYNEFSAKHGIGSLDEERLKTTYAAVSQALNLNPAWDYSQAYDARFIVKANGTAKSASVKRVDGLRAGQLPVGSGK
jgi:NitT/TauT family transport system substrate-binding protein